MRWYLSGVQGKILYKLHLILSRFQNSSWNHNCNHQPRWNSGLSSVSPIRVMVHDGNHHANVFFRNHGMHADWVMLCYYQWYWNGEMSNLPHFLTSDYSVQMILVLLVLASTSNFTQYLKDVGVGATNPGYVKNWIVRVI